MIAGFEDITSGELFIDGKKMNDVLPATEEYPWYSRTTRFIRT